MDEKFKKHYLELVKTVVGLEKRMLSLEQQQQLDKKLIFELQGKFVDYEKLKKDIYGLVALVKEEDFKAFELGREDEVYYKKFQAMVNPPSTGAETPAEAKADQEQMERVFGGEKKGEQENLL